MGSQDMDGCKWLITNGDGFRPLNGGMGPHINGLNGL